MSDEGLLIIVALIQSIVGPKTKSIPPNSHLMLKDDELLQFLKKLPIKEKKIIVEAIGCFDFYMKALKPCKEIENIGDIWTNFILILLFGLIEKIICDKNKLCYQYLKENLARCVNRNSTEQVLQEWREDYGANRKVFKFFEKYITKQEKKEIIDSLAKNPYLRKIANAKNPIKKFIDLIIRYRSGFVHELKLESVSAFNVRGYVVPDKEGNLSSDNMVWYPILSIDKLIHYVLLGVFRKFNYNKILTTID